METIEFEILSSKEFNERFGTMIHSGMSLEEMTDHIESCYVNYFYASHNDEDVTNAVKEEFEIASGLNIDYVRVDDIYIAVH
jgi:hypothetical protein